MASTFNIPNMNTAHMPVGASTLIASAQMTGVRIGDDARMTTGVPAAAHDRNLTVLAPRGAG
jgi:hypothetical protein